MNFFNRLVAVASLLFVSFSCGAQTSSDSIHRFGKIIFHSSRCYGTCPKIDFEIDSIGNITVSREYFKSKSDIDDTKSGWFRGTINADTLQQLQKVLQKSKYKNLNFPDVYCCDRVITTIIIYDNNSRTYLKSMKPPPEAKELIAFLYKIGTETILTKTNQQVLFEK